MKDIICVKITKNHIYGCTTNRIGRKGENLSTCFEITLDNDLLDLDVFMEFLKPNRESLVTPKLALTNNVATYDVPLYLLDTTGYLKVQIVLRDTATGIVWKTYTKSYYIADSICACDDIPIKEDWFTHAEDVLTQIENGLTPTIGENGNWFILDRDTGKPSRGLNGKDGVNGKDGINGKDGVDGKDGADGKDYILTEADKQEIAKITAPLVESKEPNLTGYVKESELESKVKAIGDKYYATEERVETLERTISTSYAKKEELNNYTTKEYVDTLIGDIEKELGGI